MEVRAAYIRPRPDAAPRSRDRSRLPACPTTEKPATWATPPATWSRVEERVPLRRGPLSRAPLRRRSEPSADPSVAPSAPERRSLWLLDLAVLVTLLAVTVASWQPSVPPGGLEGVAPTLATLGRLGAAGDLALQGPDAGFWAEAARDLASRGEVDCQRMPVFPHATALAAQLGADVVFAGQLVGHLAAALSVLLTWLVARLVADRGAALGAGLLVALCPALVNAQPLFGVDTTFRAAVLLATVSVLLALRGAWWRGLLAGVGLGLCAGTHYLGLLWPLPASLLLLTASGTWPQRLARAAGCAGVVLLVLLLLRRGCPFFSLARIGTEFSVGIATSMDRPDLFGQGLGATVRLVGPELFAALASTLPHDLGELATRPGWAAPLVVLVLLGLAAPWPSRRPRWDWRAGLWWLLLLLPLVGLEASDAPQRYRNYAGPLLWVLVARGCGGLVGWLDLGIRRWWPRWPTGVLAFVVSAVVVGAIQGAWRAGWRVPVAQADQHDRLLAASLREHFPLVRCLVGLTAETTFFAQIQACNVGACGSDAPAWRPHAVPGSEPLARGACLGWLQRTCGAASTFPWVVETGSGAGLPVALAPEMDAWVLAHGALVDEVLTAGRHSRIFALPCAPAGEAPEGGSADQAPGPGQ